MLVLLILVMMLVIMVLVMMMIALAMMMMVMVLLMLRMVLVMVLVMLMMMLVRMVMLRMVLVVMVLLILTMVLVMLMMVLVMLMLMLFQSQRQSLLTQLAAVSNLSKAELEDAVDAAVTGEGAFAFVLCFIYADPVWNFPHGKLRSLSQRKVSCNVLRLLYSGFIKANTGGVIQTFGRAFFSWCGIFSVCSPAEWGLVYNLCWLFNSSKIIIVIKVFLNHKIF